MTLSCRSRDVAQTQVIVQPPSCHADGMGGSHRPKRCNAGLGRPGASLISSGGAKAVDLQQQMTQGFLAAQEQTNRAASH